MTFYGSTFATFSGTKHQSCSLSPQRPLTLIERTSEQDEELAGEEAPKRHTCTDPNCCHVDHDNDRDADVDNAVEEFGSTFGAGRREMSTTGESLLSVFLTLK